MWDWARSVWDFFFELGSGAWAALAAWVAVAVGAVTIVVTGRYAKEQIRQAREQLEKAETDRLEQAASEEQARDEREQARLEQAQQAEAARMQQAEDAQKLREEQARPYVVAYMDPNPSHWGFVDLVIRNFGRTAAYAVQTSFTPELEVAPFTRLDTGERQTKLSYPKNIPMLAPGQEWRTSWDYVCKTKQFRHCTFRALQCANRI